MSKGVKMIFEFITDVSNVDEMQLAVMAYNLGLMYFVYDVAKFIVGFVHNKLENRRKKA